MNWYIINLKSRPDRLEKVLKEFEGQSVKINPIIFEAIPGINGSGLAKSLATICEMEKGNEKWVVVEDDIHFTCPVSIEIMLKKQALIESKEKNIGFIGCGVHTVYEKNTRGRLTRREPYFRMYDFSSLAIGIIYPPLYDWLINKRTEISIWNDRYIGTLARMDRINSFCLHPIICHQLDDISDNRPDINGKGTNFAYIIRQLPKEDGHSL